MFEAVPLVTTAFTLAAFLAAVAAWLVRHKMQEKERLLKTAPEEKRALLVASALEFFQVDTKRLTKQQQFELALQQIRARAQRFYLSTILIAIIALAAAVMVYALSPGGESSSAAGPQSHFQVIDSTSGDAVLRPLEVHYSRGGVPDKRSLGPTDKGWCTLEGQLGSGLSILDVVFVSEGYRFNKLKQDWTAREDGAYLIRLDRTEAFDRSIRPDQPDPPSDAEYEQLTEFTIEGAPDGVVFTCINDTNYTIDLFYYRYFPEGQYPPFNSFEPYGPEPCPPGPDDKETIVWDTFGPAIKGVFFFYGSYGGLKAVPLGKGYLFGSLRPVLEISLEPTPQGGERLKGTLRERHNGDRQPAE
jgi:hypothetical protein